MSGKGTLGDMGVMVANLPDGVYPVDVKISDAKFVAEDGTTTVFDSLNSITSLDEDPEGGIRIHIRPTDEVNDETGEVTRRLALRSQAGEGRRFQRRHTFNDA